MAINHLKIKNLTVFEEIEIDFNNGINVFIGENGTGKTHLLKLMYATLYGALYCNSLQWTNMRSPMSIAKSFFSVETISLQKNKLINKSSCAVTYNDKTSIFETFVPSDYKTLEEGFQINNIDNELQKTVSNLIFIPAKDMLTHSKGLIEMAKKYSNVMPFDKTLLDIIEKSKQWKLDIIPDIAKNVIPHLEHIIGGKVLIDNDAFYVQKENGDKIDFSVEAEGVKKIGLLWQLLMNESITKDSIIFWDEPEANINPKLIPKLVDILFELSRQGVQVFIATHDYVLAKYFEIKSNNIDVIFHSLYKTDTVIKCESSAEFRNLKNNPILKAFDSLMDDVIGRNLGE